jgi:hypothetical protein
VKFGFACPVFDQYSVTNVGFVGVPLTYIFGVHKPDVSAATCVAVIATCVDPGANAPP